MKIHVNSLGLRSIIGRNKTVYFSGWHQVCGVLEKPDQMGHFVYNGLGIFTNAKGFVFDR